MREVRSPSTDRTWGITRRSPRDQEVPSTFDEKFGAFAGAVASCWRSSGRHRQTRSCSGPIGGCWRCNASGPLRVGEDPSACGWSGRPQVPSGMTDVIQRGSGPEATLQACQRGAAKAAGPSSTTRADRLGRARRVGRTSFVDPGRPAGMPESFAAATFAAAVWGERGSARQPTPPTGRTRWVPRRPWSTRPGPRVSRTCAAILVSPPSPRLLVPVASPGCRKPR